jgi:Protein of unknown function (DUF3365)
MRAMASVAGAAVLAILAGTGTWAQVPRSWSVGDAPADARAAAARAMQAFDSVQATLSARLVEEMKAGGPLRAVTVCRDEAQALTKKIAADSGMALGRTSDRLRNPLNAQPDWAKPFVRRAAGQKAAGLEPVIVDLGDRVGVLRPIGTTAACTTCHGAVDRQPEALRRLLARLYPQDAAVGFADGDLRGFFWAEVKR